MSLFHVCRCKRPFEHYTEAANYWTQPVDQLEHSVGRTDLRAFVSPWPVDT
jgi:hypothetical protein